MCIGKSILDNDSLKITVDEILLLEETLPKYAKGYKFWLDLENCDDAKLRFFFENFCTRNHGSAKLTFNVFDKSSDYKNVYEIYDVDIPLNSETVRRLMNYFGQQSMGLVT